MEWLDLNAIQIVLWNVIAALMETVMESALLEKAAFILTAMIFL